MRRARTIRLRLTLTYGFVFLLTGALLLTIGYLLVRHNLTAAPDFRRAAQQLGVRPGPAAQPHHFSPFSGQGSEFRRLFSAARADVVATALHRLLLEYVGALLAMTALSVAAGWLLAGRTLGPLRRIAQTAQRVSGENLGERIALEGPADELKELADTFDGMLGRLDRAFASQRHFVASASHELRTPLAIMRTEIDVALADSNATVEDLRATAEIVRETVDRSESIIEALLVLARSEGIGGRAQDVDLAELVAGCVTDLSARALSAGITVQTDLEPASTRGEPSLLERMVVNLLDNGIRHNVRGGWVEMRTTSVGRSAELLVRNGGPVIAPEEVEGLVEPFRRLSRGAGGFGLGLSIVSSIAEAHGGSLTVEARPAGGLSVLVRLPRGPVGARTVASPPRARTLTKG